MTKQTGFTLIELMIVVVILGIIAAVALPTYLGYVERAECEDGKALLSGAANFMERQRAQNGGSYAGANLNSFGTSSTKFGIAVAGTSATDYTLTATATGAARLSGTMTLTAANVRGGSLAGTCNW